MAQNKVLSALLLWPLSRIYGAVISVRNLLFEIGILKQTSFDVPVIVVGNIAVGGTGKTPHTEYIINLLHSHYNIGVLSRGYKRKTKGYFLATDNVTPSQIGDEPYQMYRKFGQYVTIAVCENRCQGIRNMLASNPNINLIILDDAFQHRYVKTKFSIVLTEFSRPIYNDHLMPLGRLREPIHSLNRADIVIVTKCPEEMKPIEYREFKNNLNLYPYQNLYFSTYRYKDLQPVYPEKATFIPQLDWLTKNDSVLILSGIANPRPLVRHIKKYKSSVKVKVFDDHHDYDVNDINLIINKYNSLKGEKKYIITTEKDAVRLKENPYVPDSLKSQIFYIPITVSFMATNDNDFDTDINKMITRKL